MVQVKYKFHSHGKRGKWFSQNVRTFKEARDIKKVLDKKDKVVIMSRGKFVSDKDMQKRKARRTGGLVGSFNVRMPRFRL